MMPWRCSHGDCYAGHGSGCLQLSTCCTWNFKLINHCRSFYKLSNFLTVHVVIYNKMLLILQADSELCFHLCFLHLCTWFTQILEKWNSVITNCLQSSLKHSNPSIIHAFHSLILSAKVYWFTSIPTWPASLHLLSCSFFHLLTSWKRLNLGKAFTLYACDKYKSMWVTNLETKM